MSSKQESNRTQKIFKKYMILLLKILFIIILLSLYFLSSNQLYKTSIELNNIIEKNIPTGRIFLCSVYNNEAEMLYIQVWRLYNYIEKFIFSVSNITFSGLPKNISLSPFEKELRPYMDKIEFAYFDNVCDTKLYPFDGKVWCMDKSQRNFGKTYLEQKYNLTENDLIISVDIDEILTREGIEYIKNHPPKQFYFIKGSFYFPYYYHKVDDWNRGSVSRYSKEMKPLNYFREITIYNDSILKYENNESKPLITHCSYCFKNIEKYKNKLMSFAHQEYNKKPYITNDWIFKSHYCRIKINSPLGYDEPYEGWRHLIPDDGRLKYLVDRGYTYSLNETNYTEKDLENMCNRTYRRKPFE